MKKEQVQQELAEKGLKWVGEDYKNLQTPLKLVCDNNHEIFECLKNIRKKTWKCPHCNDSTSVQAIEKKGIRILSLDNATHNCGWAIIENGKPISSGTHRVVASDTIQRIAEVKEWFTLLCKTYEVDVCGFENVYYSGNPQTLIVLSMLLGTLCVDAYERNYKLYCMSASEWRSIVGLRPAKRTTEAFKRAAQQEVRVRFGMNVSQDTAEAIMIGLAVEKKYKIESVQKAGFGY